MDILPPSSKSPGALVVRYLLVKTGGHVPLWVNWNLLALHHCICSLPNNTCPLLTERSGTNIFGSATCATICPVSLVLAVRLEERTRPGCPCPWCICHGHGIPTSSRPHLDGLQPRKLSCISLLESRRQMMWPIKLGLPRDRNSPGLLALPHHQARSNSPQTSFCCFCPCEVISLCVDWNLCVNLRKTGAFEM